MVYYKLYDPATINPVNKCNCGNCTKYPELYHAERLTYEQITSKDRALRLKEKLYPSATIIEIHTLLSTFFEIMYINLSNGGGMRYNSQKDKWEKFN